jgi:hypothetical protein
VSQDDVRLYLRLQYLESLLDRFSMIWEEAVTEVSGYDAPSAGLAKKHFGTLLSFTFAGSDGTENLPVHGQARILCQHLKDSAPCTDLDVVGMRT